jgi:hypothetical protein
MRIQREFAGNQDDDRRSRTRPEAVLRHLMVEIVSESFSNAEQLTQKQADDLKISQLNELANREQLEIAKANLEAQRIRGLVTWRDLTRAQCEKIISSVPATGTVRIEYPSGDPEALLLSIKFENCFGQM